MKCEILLLLIQLALASARFIQLKPNPDEWRAYKSKYEKSYASEEEDSMRQLIFTQNKHLIEEFNQARGDGPGHRLALNHLSDLTEAELEMRKGYKRSELNAFQNSLKAKRFIAEILALNSPTPDQVDWRKVANRVTRVKNQGACGSCWAFAATGVLEGQELRFSQKLVGLSEQELIDCNWDGCEGDFTTHALDMVHDQGGIDSEQSYPYEAIEGECKFNKTNVVMTTSGPGILPKGDEEALKKTVASYGPVAVSLDSTGNFHHYKKGVYYNSECRTENLSHAALVVGYGTDPKEGDYWLVKNSWGPDWGENGYIRMTRNKKNNCGIASEATIAIWG